MTRSEAEQKQFIRMTETPVPRLITSLAIPTIFTMLIGAFYNMADTFFVARLGTIAAGAVGIVFAIMADKIAVLIACLYTKSAELLRTCVKFILWSREP